MYEKSIIVDIIEAKIIDTYPEYQPQGQYNNMFIKYLYRYLRDCTYAGIHSSLFTQLDALKSKYIGLTVKENTDKQTYVLTNEQGITASFMQDLILILQEYNNYEFIVRSPNRVVFKVKFGWLPPNAGSWLNLLNNETLIDYYIDGISLVPNTHHTYNGAPDSGYVCFRIDSVKEYDNILFLIRNSQTFDDKDVKFTFASLLGELEGSKGATLNRIVTDVPMNTFYALGPYNDSYLSTEKASLIIQVPYEYAISESYFVFDVTNSVVINDKNNPNDSTDKINYFVPLDPDYYSKTEEEYKKLFTKYGINIDNIVKLVNSDEDLFSTTLTQYLFGDFIWKTSDSKLIAYAQNLVNTLFSLSESNLLVSNGIWSTKLSELIRQYKKDKSIDVDAAFDDDVIDKATEEIMVAEYKQRTNLDPNENLFNQW